MLPRSGSMCPQGGMGKLVCPCCVPCFPATEVRSSSILSTPVRSLIRLSRTVLIVGRPRGVVDPGAPGTRNGRVPYAA